MARNESFGVWEEPSYQIQLLYTGHLPAARRYKLLHGMTVPMGLRSKHVTNNLRTCLHSDFAQTTEGKQAVQRPCDVGHGQASAPNRRNSRRDVRKVCIPSSVESINTFGWHWIYIRLGATRLRQLPEPTNRPNVSEQQKRKTR